MNPNTPPLVPVSEEQIIPLLATQRENFGALRGFLKDKSLRPASIFLPQTLKQIDTAFTNNGELVLDCINFLDAIKIYSIAVYGDSESYLERIKHFIVENRTVNSTGSVLARDALDDYTFESKDAAIIFLENNKLLLAIYVYSLINFILYSEA